MNIAKYQAFLCAAELGSFTKAAEKLGYTQSGLTHMMNSLEEEIGFPLLRRGYFGVRLTPNGTQLLSKIQELVKINDELESMIDDLRQNGCEVLRIGASRGDGRFGGAVRMLPDESPGGHRDESLP